MSDDIQKVENNHGINAQNNYGFQQLIQNLSIDNDQLEKIFHDLLTNKEKVYEERYPLDTTITYLHNNSDVENISKFKNYLWSQNKDFFVDDIIPSSVEDFLHLHAQKSLSTNNQGLFEQWRNALYLYHEKLNQLGSVGTK